MNDKAEVAKELLVGGVESHVGIVEAAQSVQSVI